MRYDTDIIFRLNGTATYDPDTGDYATAPTPTDTHRMAAISGTKTETMQLIYGEIRQGSVTVQVQNHYDDPFDLVVIGGKPYRVDYRRRLKVKDVFVVTEVQ